MSIQQHRTGSVLNKEIWYHDFGRLTRRAMLKRSKEEGWFSKEMHLRNYAAEEKERNDLSRTAFSIPFGNPCHPQTKVYNERKEKLAAGIFRTEYRLETEDRVRIITKTEFDFFNTL